MSTSGVTPRAHQSRAGRRRWPRRPIDTRRARASRAASARRRRVVEVVGHLVEVAGLEAALDARRVDLDDRGRRRSFMVTASGCAPPMPPRPAVTTSRPARRAAEVLARARGEASRRCPAGCPGCRCRSTSRRSSGRTSSGPAPRAGGTRPRSPTCGTRQRVGDQHARRVLVGAEDRHRLARLHEQRLVVAEPRAASRTMASKASQLRAALPGAAVDDQVLRAARPPRGRGCSSACAARPPAPSPCRRARCRAARAPRADRHRRRRGFERRHGADCKGWRRADGMVAESSGAAGRPGGARLPYRGADRRALRAAQRRAGVDARRRGALAAAARRPAARAPRRR